MKDKKGFIQSSFTMDDIKVGDQFYHKDSKTLNSVINVTSNSIEVALKKESEKGIDCKNWFTLENFNRTFEWKM